MDDQVFIDYLIVANHAEVVNGMLYLNGGGFTEVYRPKKTEDGPSYGHSFSVAISISVPDKETNKRHSFKVQVESYDATIRLGEVITQFTVNKMQNIPKEVNMHIAGAVQFIVNFPSPGVYKAKVILDDDEENSKTWSFRVHDLDVGN